MFESDLDRISDNVAMAMERIPVLADANIASVVSGPITYSPDVLGITGPAFDLPNMWLAVGTGYGIIHGGTVLCTVNQRTPTGYEKRAVLGFFTFCLAILPTCMPEN